MKYTILIKNKNHADKLLHKIQKIHEKNTQNTRNKLYSPWLKTSTKNATAHIINNVASLNDFRLRSRTRQGGPRGLLLFNTVLEDLAGESWWEKEINRHPGWKGKVTLPLCVDDNLLNIKIVRHPQKSIRAKNKWVLQGCTIQDLYTNINFISVY